MKNPIDLVYVLGKGSCWKNNEIRYSLRSVQKNLKGAGTVWVIGENPGFFSKNVRHIYHPDEITKFKNADGNMALKILRACQEPELSDDFLFMNDDFIINNPIVASDIPWLHKGDMKTRPDKFWKSQFYRFRLRRTFDVLKERGLPTMQYDYHAPMLMNKHEFPRVMEKFDFREDIGYTFRSLYGNCLALPCEPVGEWKKTIYIKTTVNQINKIVKNATFVGYNDKGVNNSLKFWMQTKFPSQSVYESKSITEDISEIQEWLNNPHDLSEGLKLFFRYSRNGNLSPRVHVTDTPALRERLSNKLKMIMEEI